MTCRERFLYRIGLIKEKQMAMTHKTASRILEAWNLEGEPISEITHEGTGAKLENVCYVGKDYVLKHTADPEKLKKHMELSEALEGVGLLTAVPIKTRSGEAYVREGEFCWCLTRRISGTPMRSRRLTPEDARFMGEIIGRLHLALKNMEDCVPEAELLPQIRDWALPAVRDVLGLSEPFCKGYLEALTRLYPTLPRQIIHRDPHPGNIIREADCWGFLDFELAERNARIYDPCYAATAVLSELFGKDRGLWLSLYREIMRGYDSVAGLTAQEREAVPYVILANQFVCVAWFAGQEQYRELYETNREMTLWLMEQLEELKKF